MDENNKSMLNNKINKDVSVMKPSPSSSISEKSLLSLSLFHFTILAIIIFITILYIKDLNYMIFSTRDSDKASSNNGKIREEYLSFPNGETKEELCDVSSGKWVRDYSRPLYEERDCPYLEKLTTCKEHGRPDNDYLYWRWQPHGCSLPSFNATLMLEHLRGKTLMLVGDSLNRNQFFSLVCLVEKVIPQHAKSIKVSYSSPSVFTAKDYNATIEYYWAPYLFQSNADTAYDLGKNARLVRNGSIDEHGKHWTRADILVFNTYLWWRTPFKILRGSFDDEVKDMVNIPFLDGYRLAISSLTRWINKNINPHKTRVFFNTMSPTHKLSKDWGGDPNGNCYNETTMATNISQLGADHKNMIMQIVREEFNKSRVPITFLNITNLSSYRKDAHASIYKMFWRNITAQELANPKTYADCIHWCLPGVPDTWNEILFSKMIFH